MRPKIVLMVLLLGIGLVGLLAVLKGWRNESAQSNGGEIQQAQIETNTILETDRTKTGTDVIASTPVEDKAARKQQDMDIISDALLSDKAEQALALIADRLINDEPEVRNAAIEGMKHLGDSNAIPLLSNALQYVEDPREKVTILDTIEYLATSSSPAPTNGIDFSEIEKSMTRQPTTNTMRTSGDGGKRKSENGPITSGKPTP